MQEGLIALSSRAWIAATWIAVASPAFALSLGDLEVRSTLGEALDARVPLGLAAGEVVDATCFALARDSEPGVPVVAEGLLTVERAGDRSFLRIRSKGAVLEPAIRVRVRAACPGGADEQLHQYSVLVDPRRGDTLHGIASKVFPRDATARDRYLQEMREVNPALATLGDDDPVPDGANVALPDLRAFSRRGRATEGVAAAIARGDPAAADTRTRAKSRKAKAASRVAQAAPAEKLSPVAPPPGASNPFVLKLSGNEVDLARTRQVDERTRSQLRERLMVLDSDDQVAAVLALRARLTQLEARVNELQLKLAQMPASFPARPAATEATASVEPPKAASAAVEAPKPAPVAPVEPPAPEAAKGDAPKEAGASAEAAKAETAPKVDTSEATVADAGKAQAPAPAAKAAPRPAKTAPGFEIDPLARSYELWAALVGVLALLMWLIWRLTHRREPAYDAQAWEEAPPEDTQAGYLGPEGGEHDEATQALAAPDAGALRQRYIEERFPEVLNGTLVLGDPASVVKVARLFYEDGAMPRAVELLQFAIEDNPAEVRTWLALFEIFRLERLTSEFAELARRFHEQHGNTEYWRKVRYFGREIDPGNFLYREDVDALETIGPGAPRRAGDERFDPARENWLDAPMDFENSVLANELRQALMANAGVVDQDLVPNPMPALRDAEMFTVA